MIHINTEQAISDIKATLGNVTHDKNNKAIAAALNRGINSGRSEGNRLIRQTYGMSAASINKAMTVNKANKNRLHAILMIRKAPISMYNFKPKQTNDGVSVTIKKGERKTIKHAFIQAVGSTVSIFARGTYQGNTFQFRKERVRKKGPDNPIDMLKGVSVASAFSSDDVLGPATDKAVEVFSKRYKHELKRILKII